MKRKTFPFYTQGTSLERSTVSAVQIVIATVLEGKSQNSECEWPLGRHYEYPIDIILSLYIDLVTMNLSSTAPGEPNDIINRRLGKFDFPEIVGFKDLSDTFVAIRDSLLKGQKPERSTVIDLLGKLTEQTENYIVHNMFLLKYYGTDLATIKSYFSNIHNIEDSADIKKCFYSIGIIGMRHLVYHLIEVNDFDINQISKLRKYSELFCLYVNFLNDMPRIDDPFSLALSILALMKAAYWEGTVGREQEFYSKESLKTMRSFGTSHERTETFKPIEILYDQALAIADEMWKNHCQYYHNEMADYLMSLDQFKGKLKRYKLLEKLNKLARGYGRVWGGKRQKSSDNSG